MSDRFISRPPRHLNYNCNIALVSVWKNSPPPHTHQSQLFDSESNTDEELMEKTLLLLMLSTHTTAICKNMTMSNNKDENNILILEGKKGKERKGWIISQLLEMYFKKF